MIYNFIKGIGSWSSDTLTAKLALGMSIFTIALVVSMQNTPCISASSCVVGDSETFSGTLKINSGNNFGHTLSGTATADRTLTMPDVSGELLVGNFTGNANKIMQVNTGANAVEYGFVDPLTQIDITSGGTQTPLAGQLLQVNTGANALTFGNVGISNINDSGTAGQFLKSSGSALSFSKIDVTDSTQIDIGTGQSGQILSVNSTGTALEYGPLPASAGSFQATAAQNVVAGTVGLEANGQVRNIDVLQSGTNPFVVSDALNTSNTNQPNTKHVTSFYNSNVDAQVVFYKDYDANNSSTCDTHIYVDVVQYANNSLSKWGRQCVSNEWSNHSGYNQVGSEQQIATTTNKNMLVKRYGLVHDETVDDYVVIYYGQQQQDGQIWGIPVSIDSTNNTIVVGTENLLHNENTCYSNGSCPGNQTNYDLNSLFELEFSDGDNKMYMWWQQYHGSYNSANYDMSHKAFTCSNLGQSSATCSPNNTHKYTTSVNPYMRQYSQGVHPNIVWDSTAQTWMMMHLWSSYDWKITQFQLEEGTYNSMNFGTYGNSVPTVIGSGSQRTDSTNNYTFQINTPYSCQSNYNDEIYDEDIDAFIFVCSYASSYNNYDTYGQVFIMVSANTSNYTGTPVVHDYWSSQYALGIEPNSTGACSSVPSDECKTRVPSVILGTHYYDTTAHKHYWYTKKHQKDGGCNDVYSNRCLAVWEWEMDATSKGVDNSTFKEYSYQKSDGTEYYNSDQEYRPFLYKDKGDDVLIAGFHFGNEGTTTAYKLSAQAFVIPDNISEYIGYVTQGANSGATVTVYSIGAVIDGLTGLTIGTEYYVKDDGSLGTSGTYKVGRAIATDKIYITNVR